MVDAADGARASGESIPGCHRSKAAQAFIGDGVLGFNLACSGARTATVGTGTDEDFKPGIDFYSDAQGRKGQALALQGLATTRNVKAVVVMIGANNYGFAAIVQRCVTNFLTSPTWWKNYRSDGPLVYQCIVSTLFRAAQVGVIGATTCATRELLMVKIASYNVENLFARAVAFAGDTDPAVAEAVLAAHGEINGLLRKAVYEQADRDRILALLAELGLLRSDDGGPLVLLRQNRGQLVVRRQTGAVEIVARGRGDWLGWVELKTDAVDEITTQNTARVVKDLDADVLAVVEAETRHSLRDFSRILLRQVGGEPFEHSMLLEGNDDRGINVGLMTKDDFAIDTIQTHIFDRLQPNQQIFSRDCPEYLIRTPGGNEILVLVNHFKSKRGGGDAKRRLQAERVSQIVEQRLPTHPNIAVVGDLNDTPGSATLAPLLTGTPLADISTHANFDDGDFPGTFGTQGAANKIDYVLLSPNLMDSVTSGGVLRTGVFSASDRWEMLPTVTTKAQQASDHAAIWAELDLG